MKNDKFKIIKGRTHWLLTAESFKKRHDIDAYSLNNWRSGNEGDWVLSDDIPPKVVQVLKKGIIDSSKGKKKVYIRTICGTYLIDGKKKMYGQIAENIYTFGGNNEYKKFLKRKKVNSKELLFARYVALGEDAVSFLYKDI